MSYKHGIYGEIGSASELATISQGTVPVYIGTLPIHRINASKLANVKHGTSANCIMLLISSYKDIKALNLYSDNWEAYSLCEAIKVHFMNGDSDIAPIILVANNTTENKAEAKTATVNITKSGTSFIGYLNDSTAVIDDMAISVAGVTFEDGDVTYEYDTDKVRIVVSKEGFNATSVEVTYKVVTGDALTTVDFAECLELLDRAEGVTGKIPNILCAPQYSDKPEFHDLLVQKAIDKVDGKWNVVVLSDLGEADSYESAIAWKNTNNYNHVLDKVCYPKLGFEGKEYHMSVVASSKMQALDTESDGIPFASASNKPVFADAIYSNVVTEGTKAPVYISEQEANELNKNGIMTAISMKGQIRLWGSHMANYNHDGVESILVENRTDVAVRMSAYIRNYLQYNYLDEIDHTMSRKDIDGIINSVQMWLDSLVNDGKLYYAAVEFDADSDLENGDVVFNLHVTYPLIAKSITFKVIHTSKGLSVLTTSEEGGNE